MFLSPVFALICVFIGICAPRRRNNYNALFGQRPARLRTLDRLEFFLAHPLRRQHRAAEIRRRHTDSFAEYPREIIDVAEARFVGGFAYRELRLGQKLFRKVELAGQPVLAERTAALALPERREI